MAKRAYYDRHPLFKTGANILMVYGQNCSGKSYQAKEELIERALRGERTFLLRRWPDDIKQNKAQLYFDDINVKKLTKNKWDAIVAYQGQLFFEKYPEEGKKERSEAIGYYGALSEWQRYKSMAFVGYTFMIYEEFITDGIYLDNECVLLQRMMTIVFRDHPGQVMMIGNTISRTVPFFMEWTPGVVKQKQGTIELYHYHDADGDGNDMDIAVEYGGKIQGTGSMFFGNAAKSINGGEWYVENQPKLPKELIFYEAVYDLIIEYQTFAFVLQLLIDPEEGTKLLYVYPRTGKRKIERVITDKFSDNIFVTRYWMDNNPEHYMRQCIEEKRVCYSDNLTASDFLSVIGQLNL